jgi:transcriptional regulator with XRE-family HTH domain
MTIQELFIDNLKIYRKLRKLSQLKLAEQCHSSQTYIAEIEVGKKFPSPDMIERIASALDVESYVLFQNKAPPGPDNRERVLSPSQRREITEKLTSAFVKIISGY